MNSSSEDDEALAASIPWSDRSVILGRNTGSNREYNTVFIEAQNTQVQGAVSQVEMGDAGTSMVNTGDVKTNGETIQIHTEDDEQETPGRNTNQKTGEHQTTI